jgi:hypothetical protein
MKLDEVLGGGKRTQIKKKTNKPMGLSKKINKHSKRQQNKAARKEKIDITE